MLTCIIPFLFVSANYSVEPAEEIISSLQILEVVSPHVHSNLLPQVFELLNSLTLLLENSYKGVRHMAARCIATLAQINAPRVMELIVERVMNHFVQPIFL